MARSTAGFTGADLENLLNEAALLAGRRDQKFITEDVIHEAVIKVIAGPEKRSRVIPEIERKLTAYHEAGHAVVIHALPDHDPVHQITIVPRGQAGGMTIFLPEEDRSYRSKAYMTQQIVSLLGGRAAEELILGDISTGASSDIQRATAIARKMVGTYGMSEKLGNVAFDAGTDEVFIGKSMGHTPSLLGENGGGDGRGDPRHHRQRLRPVPPDFDGQPRAAGGRGGVSAGPRDHGRRDLRELFHRRAGIGGTVKVRAKMRKKALRQRRRASFVQIARAEGLIIGEK